MADQARVKIFRHPLLQYFQLSLFCKMPIMPIVNMGDLRYGFIVRIIIAVLQFRVSRRHAQVNPPFIGIEMDSSDAGREGCTVSTLTITAEPKNWKEAIEVAVQEVRCLQQFGVTASELKRYMGALLRDSESLAQQANNVNSVDQLNFAMESLALGHACVDARHSHEALLRSVRGLLRLVLLRPAVAAALGIRPNAILLAAGWPMP